MENKNADKKLQISLFVTNKSAFFFVVGRHHYFRRQIMRKIKEDKQLPIKMISVASGEIIIIK